MNPKLKKTLNITGITLASLIGLVLIAFALVCWTVFTPSRLTRTARKVIDSYAPCRIDLQKADLTLVRTFPYVGLRLNGVLVHDQMPESASDTLLFVDDFTATVNLRAYLKQKRIILTNLLIDNVQANLFTDAQGHSNLDFLTENSTEKPEEESGMDIYADLQKITLTHVGARYTDLSSGTRAMISNMALDLKGLLTTDTIDADVSLTTALLNASILNDSTDFKANLDNLKADGRLSKYGNDITGRLNAGLASTYAQAGTMNASLNDLKLLLDRISLKLTDEGLGGLRTAVKLDAEDLKFVLDDMSTTTGRIALNADEAIMEGDSIHVSGFTFQSRDIDLLMKDSLGYLTKADLESLLLNIDGGLKTDLSRVNTGLSADMTGAQITIDGESPMKASAGSFLFRADGLISGDDVTLTSDVSTPALYLTMGGDSYIPGWPLSLTIPLRTNRNIDRFHIGEGAVATVNGERISFHADGTLGGTSIVKADAGIRTQESDIDKLISMIPDKFRSSLDGIDVHGILGLDLNMKADVRESGTNVERAVARIALRNLDASLNDSIDARSSRLTANIQYPSPIATDHGRESADVQVKADDLTVHLLDSTVIDASFRDLGLSASLVGLTDTITEMNARADISVGRLEASMDTVSGILENAEISATLAPADGTTAMMLTAAFDRLGAAMGDMMDASLGKSNLLAMAQYDESKEDLLLKWNPRIKLTLEDGLVNMNEMLEEPVRLPQFDVDFSLGRFNINESHVVLGESDITVWGDIYNIGEYIENTGLLTGELNLESDHVNVTQLMGWFSGMGDEEAQAAAEKVAADAEAGKDTISGPFLVPKGIDFTLYTNFSEIDYFGHMFTNVGGDVTVKDGVAVLQELGFSSDAAEMQLTAIYKSPSEDDLFMELDFHLLNIEIDELIELIPSVDSIMPMLKSFDGRAQFHLAVETGLKADYYPKMSTLIGAAAIEGQNLKVIDNEVFDGIKRKLLMSKDATGIIDSLDVEVQVLRNKVDVYPFRIKMDRYQAVIGGRHNINKDLDCGYHISLTDSPLPFRLGVDITGPITGIAESPLKHISLVRPKYKKLYKPEKRGDTEEKVLKMKQDILETLRSNVR